MLELFIRMWFMMFYAIFSVMMQVFSFALAIFIEIFRLILNALGPTGLLKVILVVLALGFLLLVVLSAIGGL